MNQFSNTDARPVNDLARFRGDEQEAKLAFALAEHEQHRRVQDAIDEATARIKRFYAPQANEVERLRAVWHEAKRLRELAEIAHAQDAAFTLKDGTRVRPGDTVIRTVRKRVGGWRRDEVEQCARVEIRTHESQFPGRLHEFRLPEMGEFFARLYRADGSLGMRWDTLNGDWQKVPSAQPAQRDESGARPGPTTGRP